MQSSKDSDTDSGDEAKKYLIFSLDEDLFGTPLLNVREVIEPQPIKKIPNTVDEFLGAINLRGEIIGVIDLRLRLGREPRSLPTNAFLIFQTEVGAIAALVDQVESISEFSVEDMDSNPNVLFKIPQNFLIGMAKLDDRLVTVLDLFNVLSQDEINQLKSSTLKSLM